MEKYLSGLNESQLRYFLFRIKEAASAKEESSLLEVDKMLHEFQEIDVMGSLDYSDDSEIEFHDDEWEIERASEELRSFEEKIANIENCINQNVKINNWKFQRLPSYVENLGSYWPKKIQENRAEDIKRIKSEAERVKNLGEFTLHSRIVDEMLEISIHNVASSQGVIRQLKDCTSYFQDNDLFTDELKVKIEKGKERVAWHRAKKKLAEAEVAEAVGSSSRVTKLKKEALVLLSQDWAVIFPGTTLPSLEN